MMLVESYAGQLTTQKCNATSGQDKNNSSYPIDYVTNTHGRILSEEGDVQSLGCFMYRMMIPADSVTTLFTI